MMALSPASRSERRELGDEVRVLTPSSSGRWTSGRYAQKDVDILVGFTGDEAVGIKAKISDGTDENTRVTVSGGSSEGRAALMASASIHRSLYKAGSPWGVTNTWKTKSLKDVIAEVTVLFSKVNVNLRLLGGLSIIVVTILSTHFIGLATIFEDCLEVVQLILRKASEFAERSLDIVGFLCGRAVARVAHGFIRGYNI